MLDSTNNLSGLSTLLALCCRLTALLRGVALLQVPTGPRGVLPAAVGTLHAVDLAAQGLERGLDTGVDGNDGGAITVRQSLIFAELRWRRGARVVVLVPKQIVHRCHGGTRGTRRACRSGFTWRSLWKKEELKSLKLALTVKV